MAPTLKYHNTLTDCAGTCYVLVTSSDSPIVRLYTYKEKVSNLQLLEAVMFLDEHNGDPEHPGPMIEWYESILIRPEVVKWFAEEGVEILRVLNPSL